MPPTNGKKKAPSCARCKNHGIESPVKGHKRHCLYKACECFKCSLTQQHQRVVAAQVKHKRQHEQDAGLGINAAQDDENIGISFKTLVETCQASPNIVAKALLMYYGSTNKVISEILAIKDETISAY